MRPTGRPATMRNTRGRHNPHTPDPSILTVGQIRADRYGSTIQLRAPTPAGRWYVTYPQRGDLGALLSPATILDLYPEVVSP